MQLSRQMVSACGLLLFLCAPAAGQPPQPPSGAPVTPGASIAGTIRSAADDKPLSRARVVATTSASQVPFVAISGANGTYTIQNLPAGNYTISASHTGFATEAYARRRSAPAGQVQVADGQKLTAIDIALNPAGAISGRVLDEDGAPFSGAVIAALVSRFENSQHVLAQVAAATSDDRGEFRVFGLEPGQYYVSAADPAFDNVGSPRGAIRYAPTYYPGTSFPDEAKPITVTPGEASRVEFKLRLVPPSWVSGRLVTFDQKELLSGAVIMTPVDSDGSAVIPAENVTLLPDGGFTFAAVPPGHYVIRARGETDVNGLALFAHFAVMIDGGDVANIAMTLRPGALLDGEVVFDSSSRTARPPVVNTIRVRAPLTDGSGFGDALTGNLQPDRRFAIRGLMDGEHQIVVEGLEAPWVVKSVLLRGANITDEVIDAREGQQLRGVRITLTDRAAELTGSVRTAKDTPAADAAVLVFPVAPQFWIRTNRRMRLARTGTDGRFTIYGLPPGNYLAVSSYTLDEGDFSRRALLDGLRAKATPFTVADDTARPVIDLHLLPALLTPASTR